MTKSTRPVALRQIEFLDAEIQAVERLITAEALKSTEIKGLMTVPGVNVICAATMLGGDRRYSPVRELAQAHGLPRSRPAGEPVGHRAGNSWADLKAGLDAGPTRAGRGELVSG